MISPLILLKSKIGHYVLIGIVALGIGGYLRGRLSPPTTHTVTVHDVQTVTVDVPVLTEKIIDRIVTDPKQVKAISALLKENNELKIKVGQVVSTSATNNVTGGTGEGGTITPGDVQVHEPGSGGTTPNVASWAFEDYQLTAKFSSTAFSYDLNQKFILETSTGKDPSGQVTTLVKLYQDSPTGLRLLPAQSISVNSNPDIPRWMISPRVQGGLSIDQTKSKGGFVGVQWLKHGTSRDPKDLRWSVGTIGVVVGDGVLRPVVLPVSFNIGSLPYQPFSNLWLSVGVDKSGKAMLVLSASF